MAKLNPVISQIDSWNISMFCDIPPQAHNKYESMTDEVFALIMLAATLRILASISRPMLLPDTNPINSRGIV